MQTDYKFEFGHLFKKDEAGRITCWVMYELPDCELRAALQWNDKDGDFEECDRQTMLEIFIVDFLANTKQGWSHA